MKLITPTKPLRCPAIFCWIAGIIAAASLGAALSSSACAAPPPYGQRPADTYLVHPTLPGLEVRDRTAPSLIIHQYDDGSEVGYETLPGLNVRDYTKPGYMIERVR